MRLIDADELKQHHWFKTAGGTAVIALTDVDAAPTINARIEEHGTWEPIVDAYGHLEGWLCACGRESKEASNYCPQCGKIMDTPV